MKLKKISEILKNRINISIVEISFHSKQKSLKIRKFKLKYNIFHVHSLKMIGKFRNFKTALNATRANKYLENVNEHF